jgi:hypothetical protein
MFRLALRNPKTPKPAKAHQRTEAILPDFILNLYGYVQVMFFTVSGGDQRLYSKKKL